MGSGRTGSMAPDLFAVASTQETASPSPTSTAKDVQRYVLPSDLPTAIKHLNDQELEQLLAAVTEEQLRRGKIPPAHEKILNKRVEAATLFLTPGKLNAVRAAYKAGVTPSKIAKQFGLSQSDVRKALGK